MGKSIGILEETRAIASLATDASGNYLIKFRYGRRPDGKTAEFTKSANTKSRPSAEAAKALVEDTIMRLRRGWLTLPEAADPGEFIMSGGNRTQKPQVAPIAEQPRTISLGDLFTLYDRDFPAEAKELTTLQTERIHKAHLLRILTPSIDIQSINLAGVQRYANRRAMEQWRGRPILPPTILKELATLRVIWNWGLKQGHVESAVPFRDRDLNFARTEQRPPFQTMDAIRKTIDRGGMTEVEQSALWECLYLTLGEIHQVLDYVRVEARHRFIYPMFVLAAMTGARRSEICRSRLEDIDFESGTISIREKKRKRGRTTFRPVDMNGMLTDVLRQWMDEHPGGQHTICKDGVPLTVKVASNHLRQTFKGSRWAVIPGFHTFRHSFASILASEGVDETTIDRWMGHQTQEQRERYRHLFPKNRKRAIELLCPPA